MPCILPSATPTCLQLIDWALLPRAALGVLALLCGNGYIVGINQAGLRLGEAGRGCCWAAQGALVRPACAAVRPVQCAPGRLPACTVHCSVSYSLLPAAAAVAQIYDVEIDAVNKPFLPVAAGELSKGAAWALCLLLAAGEARWRVLHCMAWWS